jgi:hypothetical protein
MAIPGNWMLHFDWNSDGTYNIQSMTFNSGGTWTSDREFTGSWAHVEGMFILNIKGSSTVYAGLVASGSVTGNMTTFTGSTGSWYMLKEGASLRKAEGPDLTGGQRNH